MVLGTRSAAKFEKVPSTNNQPTQLQVKPNFKKNLEIWEFEKENQRERESGSLMFNEIFTQGDVKMTFPPDLSTERAPNIAKRVAYSR